MALPSKGVRLAIDVGTTRIGVARCDREHLLAVPVQTISAGGSAVLEISQIAKDLQAELIYVGKPISLGDKHTNSTEMAVQFAIELQGKSNIPIRLLDERLTSVSAQTKLHETGKKAKDFKSVIDQVAAVILLDHAMAIEKSTGTLAGESVTDRQVWNGQK